MAEEGDEVVLTRLADLSHAYASADPACLIPLQDCLDALLQRTKDVLGRESLGKKGAVASLIGLAPSLSAHSQVLTGGQQVEELSGSKSTDGQNHSRSQVPSTASLVPLLLLFRSLRNLCAGVEASQNAFREHGGHDLVATTIQKLLDEYVPSAVAGEDVARGQDVPRDVLEFLRASLQLLGNFAGGGAANQEAVWGCFFPERFRRLAALPTSLIQEPLCMVIFTCCRANHDRRRNLCEEGVQILAWLLSAAAPGRTTVSAPDAEHSLGGGDFLQFLIRSLCICDHLFPPLFHSLSLPLPPSLSPPLSLSRPLSPSPQCHTSTFTPAHVSLLFHIRCILASEAPTSAATSPLPDVPTSGVASSAVPAQRAPGTTSSAVPARVAPDTATSAVPAELSAHLAPGDASSAMPAQRAPGTTSSAVPARVAPDTATSAVPAELPAQLAPGDASSASDRPLPMDRQSLLQILDIVREAAIAVRRRSSEAAQPRGSGTGGGLEMAGGSGTAEPAHERSLAKNHGHGVLLPLPTGQSDVDTLGEGLALLRMLCTGETEAAVGPPGRGPCSTLAVLSSSGLVPLILDLLRCLGPPGAAKRTQIEEEWAFSGGEGMGEYPRVDPYVGYRRDVVAVIGNACYRHRGNQEEVRERDGLLLVLQQCQVDEVNPFLREWGLWAIRNLIEGNQRNRDELASLEARDGVDTPEIKELGLRVEVNRETGRPKLVNVSGADMDHIGPA